MIVCTKCEKSKEETEFHLRSKKTGRRHSYCKNCHTIYVRERYRNNAKYRKSQRESIKRNDARYKKKAQAVVSNFRKDGCFFCNEKEYCCLDAHHVDPTEKDFNVGDGVRRKISARRIEKELTQCVCVCKNCHAKLHKGILSL